MKGLRKFMFGTRKRAVISVAVLALVFATAGFAAWLTYTGVTGSSTGTTGTPTPAGAAFTITADPVTNVGPGDTPIPVTITNNDQSRGHTLNTLVGTVSGLVSPCLAKMVVGMGDIVLNDPYAAGEVKTGNLTLTLDPTFSPVCGGQPFTITYSGTSTP